MAATTAAGAGVADPTEANDFIDQLRAKGSDPALVALIRNAYRLKREPGNLTFFFDRTHGNLIPMLKMGPHYQRLGDLAEHFFGTRLDIHFSVGSDPTLQEARELNARALEAVKADPRVQFIIERFKGNIIKWNALDNLKE